MHLLLFDRLVDPIPTPAETAAKSAQQLSARLAPGPAMSSRRLARLPGRRWLVAFEDSIDEATDRAFSRCGGSGLSCNRPVDRGSRGCGYDPQSPARSSSSHSR
jgi:hypothetical protein